MAFQIFTPPNYTELDPDSRIVIDVNDVNFTDLNRNDDDTYISKDFGVGHFTSFEHLVETKITAQTTGAVVGFLVYTNTLNDILALTDALMFRIYAPSGSAVNYILQEVVAGDNSNFDSFASTPNTAYWSEVEKDNEVGTYGTMYIRIYSDSARTVLVDTLSITLRATLNPKYIEVAVSWNDGQDASTTGYVKNLDLQEAVAAPSMLSLLGVG